MNIDINGVKITLTKEQLNQIAAQTSKIYTIDDIQSVFDACEILNIDIPSRFKGEFNSQWEGRQLELIIKAVNYIDNNYKEYIPNFEDSSCKYIPYFKKESGGWVFCNVDGFFDGSYGQVGFYYKVSKSAEIISKRFINLYNQYIG